MKKLFVLGAALVAALAVGAVTAPAKPTVKVKTKVTIKFKAQSEDPYLPRSRAGSRAA